MAKMLGYCGMDCAECPAYIATQKKDEAMKVKVAEGFTSTVGKAFGMTFTAKDINCDGCVANKTLLKHCAMCPVRKCGVDMAVENCGACEDWGCEKLTKQFQLLPPHAKTNLEAFRAARKS